MDWQSLKPNVKFAKNTLIKRNGQIDSILPFLVKLGFNPESQETYKTITLDQFLEFLDSKKYATRTKIGFLETFSGLVVHFGGSSHLVKEVNDKITELRFSAFTEGSSVVSKPVDDDLRSLISDVIENQNIDTAIKILGEISLSEMCGARLTDLRHTTIYDDGEHSHLDMETGVWTIRSNNRKGKNRTVQIPDELMERLRLYEYHNDWLLTSKQGKPYEKTSNTISKKFKEAYGCCYGELRKGSCDTVHEKDDVKATIEHAQVMGHSLATELRDYVKPKITIKTKKSISSDDASGYSVESVDYSQREAWV